MCIRCAQNHMHIQSIEQHQLFNLPHPPCQVDPSPDEEDFELLFPDFPEPLPLLPDLPLDDDEYSCHSHSLQSLLDDDEETLDLPLFPEPLPLFPLLPEDNELFQSSSSFFHPSSDQEVLDDDEPQSEELDEPNCLSSVAATTVEDVAASVAANIAPK